ncbi:hypothetical protein [Enterococcus faecalis]|uniref:hypothetical protein n=2 Tax=Enterococcus faecalis TaxID=1351 RepID=UPI0035EB33F8
MKKISIHLLLSLSLMTILLFNYSSVFAEENHSSTLQEEFNISDTNYSLSRTTTKFIYQTITIRKGASIPNYYWYDDGQFRGNLKLQRWQDYGEDPNIRGYICTYGGYVTNGSSPAQRFLDINEQYV